LLLTKEFFRFITLLALRF